MYRIYTIIALVVLSLIQFSCYSNMQKDRDAIEAKTVQKYEEKRVKEEQEYQAEIAKQQRKINKLSADYETEKAKYKVKVETVTKYVDKIVERDVYRNVCIDDDGMQSINSLIQSRGTS